MIYADYYTSGFNAFSLGLDLDDNPHKRYTIEWASWKDGWEDANSKS